MFANKSAKRLQPEKDVIDSTAEDDVINLALPEDSVQEQTVETRRKKRKSEKREKQFREFQRYLSSLPPLERNIIDESNYTIHEEKESAMKSRNEFSRNPMCTGDQFEQAKNSFDNAVLFFESAEVNIRERRVDATGARSLAEKAQRLASGIRRELHNVQSTSAINRFAEDARRRELEMLRNDPVFNDAQRNSMVTPVALSTNGRYRPLYTPEDANQDLIRRALRDDRNPGLLPDGSIIPPHLIDHYRNRNWTEDQIEDGSLSTITSNYRETEYLNTVTASDKSRFENMVDLASNEAEPLDFPPEMQCATSEHQRQGLGWLIRAERGHNKGGILADDMGLGKTVQTIALFYANPPPPISQSTSPTNQSDYRMILIVCPVALISTWEEELRNRVKPDHRMRVYVHHSVNKKRTNSTKQIEGMADIVICSYHAIANEYKQLQNFKKVQSALEAAGNTAAARRMDINQLKTPMFKIKWHRIVLDEAHLIKNKLSQMSIAAQQLIARYRIALTGTPMQNGLEELYPLVRFLHLEPHQNWTAFKKLSPLKGTQYVHFDSQKALAAFLSATLSRRKKDTIINGRKIIDNLPPKVVKKRPVSMKGEEQEKYGALEKQIQNEFKKAPGLSTQNLSTIEETMTMSNMLVYLLRLRQTACHPLLMEITAHAHQGSSWGNNDYTKSCVRIAMGLNRAFGENALSYHDDNRVCFNCEGPAAPMVDVHVMSRCGHIICSECMPSLMDLNEGGTCTCGIFSSNMANLEILYVIQNENPHSVQNCLDRLLAYQRPRVESQRRQETERKNRMSELRSRARQNALQGSWFMSEPEDLDDFIDEEISNLGSPRTITSADDTVSFDSSTAIEDSEDTNGILNDDHGTSDKSNTAGLSFDSQENVLDLTGSPSGQSPIDEIALNHTNGGMSLTPNNMQPSHPKVRDNVKLEDPSKYQIDIDEVAKLFKIPRIFTNGWVSSAKVECCLEILREIWRISPEDKVIIFTSFTSLIDVLSIPSEAAMIPYEEYTGRQSVQERNDVLERFKSGRCRVLLTSLKAGNVGSTLTQANRVVIMEPFWNPFVEEQAQDRVYRIGQSREVTVYRLLVTKTVEDRIVHLQEKKRSIIESALDNSTKTKNANMSRSDVMFALGLRQ